MSNAKVIKVESCSRVKNGNGSLEQWEDEYEWSDEGVEDEDGKERSELPGGWERVEIAWCRGCIEGHTQTPLRFSLFLLTKIL